MRVRTRNYTVNKNQFFSILLILCSIFSFSASFQFFFFNSGHFKQFAAQSCSVMSCSQLLLSAVLNNGLLEDNKSKLEQVSIYVFSSKLQSCYQLSTYIYSILFQDISSKIYLSQLLKYVILYHAQSKIYFVLEIKPCGLGILEIRQSSI